MQVLHITRDFPPQSTGGISTVVAGMVRALKRAGIPCGVISFDAWRPRSKISKEAGRPAVHRVSGVQVMRVSAPPQVEAARKFAEAFSGSGRPTVLHVHHEMLWDFAAGLRCPVSPPVVFSVHVLQREQMRLHGSRVVTLSLTAQEKALHQADHILAPSRAVADLLRKYYTDLKGNVLTLAQGVQDSRKAREAVTARRGRCGGPVLYVGRFSDIKGTGDLFAAIPTVLQGVQEASFVLAGGVPENLKTEVRWKRHLERTVPSGVQSRVRLAGWCPPGELAAFYREASLLVCPSRFETFGLSVLEAMLHGLPVAATRCGGLPELIKHGSTGLLSPPRDVRALKDNILTLLHNPETAAKMGAEAARVVRQRWLWEHLLPSYRDLYREVLT